MTKPYGQYCPVALATEIVGERWTILVVMVLADGFRRFNEIQRALPRISASTLTQRLRSLEDAGVVERQSADRGDKWHYFLTEAGLELGQLVYSLGRWGHRWGRDLETDDLDPEHLIWSMHMRMNLKIMPKNRTTIAFEFTDQPQGKRYFWIVVQNGIADACLKHPGFDEDIRVISKLQPFTDAWRGFCSLREEVETGRIVVKGPVDLVRTFPDWLLLSMLASEERRIPGRERSLQLRTERKRSTPT
jgi:DNA-binding HxlR family transcriptional regulator